jgi:CHAT domain-containing protein
LNKGNLELAMRDAERGLTLYPSRNSQWHWRFRVLKAEVLVWQHRNDESLAMSAEELPPYLATSDLAVWQKLSQTAASAYVHQFPNAHRYLEQAEAIARIHHPELLGQVSLRKGTVLFREGAIADAEAAFRSALQLARKEKDPFLETAALGSLGIVATKQGHYDESLDWDRAALQLSHSIGAQSSAARILGNMGWSLRKLGDYDGALEDYRQADEAANRIGQIGDELYWRTGIAAVYYLQREYASAQDVLEQRLGQARLQDDKSITTQYLNELSELAIETAKTDVAEAYSKEAAEIEQAGRDQSGVLDTLLIAGRIAGLKHQYRDAEKNFLLISNDLAASVTQRWEAQARLAKVYDQRGETAKAEQEYKHSIRTIQAARQSVGQDELRLSFLSGAIDCYDDYIDFLIQHGRVEDALRVADLTRSQTLAEGLALSNKAGAGSSRKPPPRQLAQELHAALFVYWIGKNNSHLWVINAAGLHYFHLPKRAEIDPMVKVYRQAIVDGRDVLSSDVAAGEQLYSLLVAPARNLVARNSRVILFPAESLYGLNFETLVVPGENPHFWIEDVVLSTASSLDLLRATNQNPIAKERNLLLVGNPDPPNQDFPYLALGPVEMHKVSEHFAEAHRSLLEGKQATASEYVRSHPERFAYLHFVTHGTASQTRPLESAVILSKEGDSYKLYARDIVAHPLAAQLVTISACNGAGKRTFAGEGLVGLSWAFLRAGARNVIASLWEVSDSSSTPELMEALYEGIDRGEDPAAALRQAKLSVLKSNSKTVFRKPFYWAPFQLYVGS